MPVDAISCAVASASASVWTVARTTVHREAAATTQAGSRSRLSPASWPLSGW